MALKFTSHHIISIYIFIQFIKRCKTSFCKYTYIDSKIDNIGKLIVVLHCTRFTKWSFVWVKNPQKFETAYLIQFFTPVTNPPSILRLSQRFWFYFNFSTFLQDFTHIFFVFYQNCRKIYQYNHATKEKHRTF